jgi:hypothetical protein
MRISRVALICVAGAMAILASGCVLDPTELTRTVFVTNGLTNHVLVQTCRSRDCTQHTGGHLIGPGETSREVAEDTAVNPFRVVVRAASPTEPRCFSVGPKVPDGMHIRLVRSVLIDCPT